MAYNTTIEFLELSGGAGLNKGYFTMKWKVENLPSNHRVFFCCGQSTNWMDVTPGYSKLLLGNLLKVFKKNGLWGETMGCWLETGAGPTGATNIKSNILPLALPVRPFPGPLTTIALQSYWPPFTYTGTGLGRFFELEKLDGNNYFFKYGPNLENDDAMRGMDCTTFPRALFELTCNVAGSIEGNNLAALNIAQALNATTAGIEGVTRDTMRQSLFGLNAEGEFTQAPKVGLYLLWNMGHIMLYRGEQPTSRYGIHEFTGSGPQHNQWKSIGYKESSITERSFISGTYWARKIPQRHEWHVVNTVFSDTAVPDFGASVRPPGNVSTSPPKGPSAGIGKPANGGGGNGGGGKQYTVVSGDSLSLIAGKYWQDVLLWPIIYDANRQVVGPDPNKISPGQRLTIPDIGGYSQQELTSVRNRGRNC